MSTGSASLEIGGREYPIEACRSCGAPVVFAVGKSGAENPIEPEVLDTEHGNVRLFAGDSFAAKPLARYDRKDDQPSLDDDGVRFVSHFAHCPHAERWRRR